MNHLSSGLLAVLLDRDGVINEEPGPVFEPAAFRIIPGSAEAVAVAEDVMTVMRI